MYDVSFLKCMSLLVQSEKKITANNEETKNSNQKKQKTIEKMCSFSRYIDALFQGTANVTTLNKFHLC